MLYILAINYKNVSINLNKYESVVINKENLNSQGQRAKDQIDILYKISQSIVNQHNVSTLLEDVLVILDTEMGMSRGILTLRKPETDIFAIEASKGLTDEEKRRGQYGFGEGIIGRVAQSQKPEFVQDISTLFK